MHPIRLIFNFKIALFLLPALFLFWHTAADVIASGIAIVYLIHSGNNNNWRWIKKPWIIAAFSLWLYSIFVSSSLAVYPKESYEISILFIRFIIFAAALAYWILQDEQLRKWFEYGVIAVVIFIVIDVFIQATFGKDLLGHVPRVRTRLNGPFSNLIPGTYVTKLIFIALASLFYSTKIKKSDIKIGLFVLSLSTVVVFLFLTGERSAFLNYLLGCAIVTIGLFVMYPTLRFWLLGGSVAMIVSVGIFAVANPTMQKRTIESSYQYIIDWPNSSNGRIVRSAIDIWINTNSTSLYTGVGLRNYRHIVNDTANNDLKKKYYMAGYGYVLHPHNIYVEWLVGGGILGLLGFVTMIALVLKELVKRNTYSQNPAIPLFAVAVFMTTFWPLSHGMNFFTNRNAAIIWMTIGWALAVTVKKQPNNNS